MEEEDDDDNHTMRLRTSSTSLQAKLDQLVDDIARDDRRSFVTHFVPLDLSVADTEAYLDTLLEISRSAARGDGMEEDNNNNAGGDEEWRNVAAEMVALATGRGVTRLGGDQIHRTVFYFCHPLLAQCDREVTFVCSSDGEWRAEG